MRSLSPHACGPRLISSIPIIMLLDGSRAWVHAAFKTPPIGALDFFPTLRPAHKLGVCPGALIRGQRLHLLPRQGLRLRCVLLLDLRCCPGLSLRQGLRTRCRLGLRLALDLGTTPIAFGNALPAFWRSWPCRQASMDPAFGTAGAVVLRIPRHFCLTAAPIPPAGHTAWPQVARQTARPALGRRGQQDTGHRTGKVELLLRGERARIDALVDETLQALGANLRGHPSPRT